MKGRFNEGFQEREPVSSFSRHDVQKPFFKNKECLFSLQERGKATFLSAGLVLIQPQLLFCSASRFFPLMLQIWPVF